MGYLTRADIVTRGIRDAAVSSTISTRGNEWLNSWLRSQYTSWPWPFLTRRLSGLAMTSGTTSKTVGASNGGITDWVHRIYDPVLLYNTAYTVKQTCRVESHDTVPLIDSDVVNDPTKHTGIPEKFLIYMNSSTQGALDLIPNVFPNQDMLASFDYWMVPLNIDETSGGDTTKPPYPNDQTMVTAVKAYALDFDRRSQEALTEFQKLSSMISDDRIKFGSGNGQNQKWSKDPRVYRPRM